MSQLQQYQVISKEDFENELSKYRAREVPPQFYTHEWIKSGSFWEFVKRKNKIWEYCYIIGIHANAGIVIYSSINRGVERSRTKGTDAI